MEGILIEWGVPERLAKLGTIAVFEFFATIMVTTPPVFIAMVSTKKLTPADRVPVNLQAAGWRFCSLDAPQNLLALISKGHFGYREANSAGSSWVACG